MAKIGQNSLPVDHPFDYQLAMQRLRGFDAPRNKLAALCDSGELLRVKRGLYLAEGADIEPAVLAGLIYGPSYLSLEWALSRHGLIPERVGEFTSVSTKRARVFETPLGRFSYRSIPVRVFSVGVGIEQATGGSFFIASPEKALCDRIAHVRGLSVQRDVAAVLEEDLRVATEPLLDLDTDLVDGIARRYGRSSVNAFAAWLKKTIRKNKS